MISDVARARVRARFEADMTDAVTVTRAVAGVFDEASGETVVPAGTAVYSGKARLAPISPSGDVSLGDGEIPQRQGQAQLPWDSAPVHINDLLTVQSAQDPQLAQTTWRVVGVDGGGAWMAKRTLTLSGWYANEQWAGS